MNGWLTLRVALIVFIMTMVMPSITMMLIVFVIAVTVRAMSVGMVVRAAFVPRLLLLRLLMMRRMLVVLLQQIESVVVAVGGAHDGMDVELRGLRIGKENAGVMVELNEGYRALHPVVERALLTEPADPAETRFGEIKISWNTCRGMATSAIWKTR